MIVSCHVPKTAGTSFGELLVKNFGDRVLLDYGDRVGWDTDEGIAWRESRNLLNKPLPSKVHCVHGHFYLSKYLSLQPNLRVVTFVRDPVERVISNFRFLRSHPKIRHPLVAAFHEANPTLGRFRADTKRPRIDIHEYRPQSDPDNGINGRSEHKAWEISSPRPIPKSGQAKVLPTSPASRRENLLCYLQQRGGQEPG